MKYCDTCRTTYPTEFTTCPKDQSPLRVASELMQGMVVRGKYEILEKIGAGGMATVYKARHTTFNELRALKVVSSKMLDDENFLKRFRNEAVITRKLQHPNAVRIDDIDTTDDGRPFLVMEYLEGENLRELVSQHGPVPLGRALAIARQAALALGAAHRLGITHRDIKPDNIIIRPLPDGTDAVKVLDFGIAKARESGSGAYTATQTGMVVGTPQYISPEQAMGKGGDQLDGRADLYSLGIVLYEMLTARLPFESDTPMGLLLHHMQTPPPTPNEVRPDLDIPAPVTMLLMKALEKAPARRFQSAEEMAAALHDPAAWARSVGTAGVPTEVMGSAATRAVATPVSLPRSTVAVAAAPARAPSLDVRHSRAPRRKWLLMAVAIVVLLGIAAGVFWMRSRPGSPLPVETVPAQSAATQPRFPPKKPPVASEGESEHRKRRDRETRPAVEEEPQQEEAVPSMTARELQVRALMFQGRRFMKQGRYRDGAKAFRAALALDPNNREIMAELAKAELAQQVFRSRR